MAGLIGNSLDRAGDIAARYGGEEFVILLPETDLAGALKIAEKIRSSVETNRIEHSASPLGKLTISSGVVSINAAEKDGHTAALAEGDRLLYLAKTRGRNRVEGRLIHGWHGVSHFAWVSTASS